MSKSKSNKIMFCGGGGQHYVVLNKISTLKFYFLGIFTIFKQYFPRKRLDTKSKSFKALTSKVNF